MYKLTVNNRTNHDLYQNAKDLDLIIADQNEVVRPPHAFGGRYREELVESVTLDLPESVVEDFAERGRAALLEHICETHVDVSNERHLMRYGRSCVIGGRFYMSPTSHAAAVECVDRHHRSITAEYHNARALTLPERNDVLKVGANSVMVIDYFDGVSTGKPNTVHLLVDGYSRIITVAEFRYSIAVNRLPEHANNHSLFNGREMLV